MNGAAIVFALAATAGDPPSVLPRTIEWSQLDASTFDRAHVLPADLRPAEDGGGPPVDLARAMRRVALDRYASKPGATETWSTFGDVVRAVRAAGNDARACESVLARVRESQPTLWRDIEPWAAELLCDAAFRAAKWDPDEDDACDGIAFARPLTLKGRTEPVWKKRDSADLVYQAAVLVYADLEAIKAAENDYRTYPSRPNAAYERIGPIADTYVVGKDARGDPFSALRILFESDLPFPFSTFTCDLHVLNRVDERSQLVCDVYSTSRDFHWIAGRDHFYPVRASDGAWVAMLVVRWHGFDLRGVPDDDSARRAALRQNLGGLKRAAEEAFRAYGGKERTVEGAFPAFEVYGKTQR